MQTKLTFLGGAGTVTGSKFLINDGDKQWLVDCGLFQGLRKLRRRNWETFPIAPDTIDGVFLTHAHLDHSGYLPVLVRRGFKGPVYCTAATRDLCGILLSDSGYLQEREAEHANRHAYSRHHPAKPLYTKEHAEAAMDLFEPVQFGRSIDLTPSSQVQFVPAGHILGAGIIRFSLSNGHSIVFSGDLGRPGSSTMPDPTIIRKADYLVVESTYGNRQHDHTPALEALASAINQTVERGGTLLIPSFAVGRAQWLLHALWTLKRENKIGHVPIFLDSPMAINASDIFCEHSGDHRLTPAECRAACSVATYVRETEGSKELGTNAMPKIIISASGMATGGRILHHLKHYLPDARNTVLFAGFQAAGTRGAKLVDGARVARIHGKDIPVEAEVDKLDMLSAHADADEILDWLSHFEQPPRKTFITHGEPSASQALRERIELELGWSCQIPELGEMAQLT
ncbi:MAG: MBL fold metallo-hydrolase [Maricaulis sp.]|jgi:metallo-beta-lactamase family protein|nr:MBL fold metallo-hydrolase [Maricaulis sp.]